jgi:two-component system nitrate/nitrite response regulator NarL
MQSQPETKTVEVFETIDPESAIAVVRQRPGNSRILFDLGLSAKSSIEVSRVFRENPDCVSAVVLSSVADEKTAMGAPAYGAMGFIPKAASKPVLTDRQKQVFRLVVQGKSNKVIARDLGVTEATVKSHIRPILQSLNVTSRVGAIVEMARLGLSID